MIEPLSLLCCLVSCLTGPSPNTPGQANYCVNSDADHDLDVDLRDVAAFLNSVDEMESVYYTPVGVRALENEDDE